MTENHIQARDLVLLIISECGDNAQFGRTSMQKVSYLTSLVLRVNLGHRAYYYGPYSAAVEADAEALTLSGLVEETMTPLGVNRKGFAVNQYHYRVTDSGRARLERVSERYADEVKTVRSFVREIHEVVGSFDQDTLSAAAKTLYIAREQQKPVTTEEVQTLAKDFGWTLPRRRVEHVAEMLAKLHLVETST